MKIAYLSEGNSVYDRRFLEKMVERGYQPYLISYWPGKLVQVNGVETLHYDFNAVPRFKHFQLLQVAWHLRGVLKRIKPDILHTGYLRWHGVIGALSGFHPTLSMPWGSDILIWPNESSSAKRFTRLTLRRADIITCDCQLVKDRIIELIGCQPEKVVVFPWGIDLDIFKPSNGPSLIRQRLGWEENEILIMTRNFRPVYGIKYFIEALPSIVRQRHKARVILVGSGSLEQSYRKQITKLRLERYVYFAGTVDEGSMAGYLNTADVYVTTSLSDGTSTCMLEAMACGLPVVVSDTPAYFEWVKDGINGYIFPRKDSNTLAQKIVQLLKDDSLRKKMGTQNYYIAQERADWEKNFDTLETIYKTLVTHRVRRN